LCPRRLEIAREVSFDSAIEWPTILFPEMSAPATARPPPSATNNAINAMTVDGCLQLFTSLPQIEIGPKRTQ
jgi:hypothetical protein